MNSGSMAGGPRPQPRITHVQCDSIREFQLFLRQAITANAGTEDVLDLTFSLTSAVKYTVLDTKALRFLDPTAASYTAREVTTAEAVANQPVAKPMLQSGVMRSIQAAISQVDGFMWLVNHRSSTGAEGNIVWRFVLDCSDSHRHFKKRKSTTRLMGEAMGDSIDQTNESGVVRCPSFDCEGELVIDFCERTILVHYRHCPIHRKAKERDQMRAYIESIPARLQRHRTGHRRLFENGVRLEDLSAYQLTAFENQPWELQTESIDLFNRYPPSQLRMVPHGTPMVQPESSFSRVPPYFRSFPHNNIPTSHSGATSDETSNFSYLPSHSAPTTANLSNQAPPRTYHRVRFARMANPNLPAPYGGHSGEFLSRVDPTLIAHDRANEYQTPGPSSEARGARVANSPWAARAPSSSSLSMGPLSFGTFHPPPADASLQHDAADISDEAEDQHVPYYQSTNLYPDPGTVGPSNASPYFSSPSAYEGPSYAPSNARRPYASSYPHGMGGTSSMPPFHGGQYHGSSYRALGSGAGRISPPAGYAGGEEEEEEEEEEEDEEELEGEAPAKKRRRAPTKSPARSRAYWQQGPLVGPDRSRRTRSNRGCGPCRKDHQKCDEVHPTCGRCSFRNEVCAWPGRSSPRKEENVKANKERKLKAALIAPSPPPDDPPAPSGGGFMAP